jgi:hypothetical protein
MCNVCEPRYHLEGQADFTHIQFSKVQLPRLMPSESEHSTSKNRDPLHTKWWPSKYGQHHSLTHRAELFLRSHQLCSHSRTSEHFMELEASLPCSQEPSIGPYPEPHQSNPIQSTPSHPISPRCILILSTHQCLGLLSGLFMDDIIVIKAQ